MAQAPDTVDRTAFEPGAWNVLATTSDDAWLWHRFEYQEALARWPGRRDVSFALPGPKGALAAIVPLQLVDVGRGPLRLTRSADSFGGPAISPSLEPGQRPHWFDRALDAARARAAAHGAVFLDVRLPTLAPRFVKDLPTVNPLVRMGFENRIGQSYVLDLRVGMDALWAGLEGRTRTVIRRAREVGVKIREANAPEDLDRYYALHRETYRRTGATPHPRDYFAAIWRFVDAGSALALFAELDAHVVAAGTFAIDRGTSFYWTAANDTRGLETGAGALLQWEAIQRLAAGGVERHELGDAFPDRTAGKERGLDLFKRSFGGALHPVFRGRLVLRPRLCAALQGARALRDVVRGR